MCGICGILGKHDDADINRMLDVLHNRGPDKKGIYSDKDISIGATVLAINDPTAVQPFSNEKGEVHIAFNGEIYNYKEIKELLIKKGHNFSTNTDVEVVVHLFEEYGTKLVKLLKGMFAFVLWDGKSLLLGRDRHGVKPLYYFFSDDIFIFGSEIKPILQHPHVPRKINRNALIEQSVFGFILSTHLTIFDKIMQVPPGTLMKVWRNHSNNTFRTTTWKYPNLRKNNSNYTTHSADEQVSQVFSKIEESCKLIMQQDTQPKALFLSGGIDSSLLALLCSVYSSSPLHTFTIADSSEHPDIESARKISEETGTIHHEIIVSLDEVIKELPNIVYSFEGFIIEDVFSHAGEWAFSMLSKSASKHTKVAICGEGADELFCGYWMHKYPLSYYKHLMTRLDSFNFPYSLKIKDELKRFINNGGPFIVTYEILLNSGLPNYHLWGGDKASMQYGLEVRYPYLYDDLINTIPFPERGTEKFALNEIIRKYFNRSNNLSSIMSRKKESLPSSLSNVYQELVSLCEDVIGDKYVETHPWRKYLRTKLDILIFDVFSYLYDIDEERGSFNYKGDIFGILE